MSSRIEQAEVHRIALLARLKLSDEEVARFGPQLEGILTYVDQLNEVDTQTVAPTAHPLPVHSVLRDDTPGTPLGIDKTLANAPARETPYFRVPKVLDQETA